MKIIPEQLKHKGSSHNQHKQRKSNTNTRAIIPVQVIYHMEKHHTRTLQTQRIINPQFTTKVTKKSKTQAQGQSSQFKLPGTQKISCQNNSNSEDHKPTSYHKGYHNKQRKTPQKNISKRATILVLLISLQENKHKQTNKTKKDH